MAKTYREVAVEEMLGTVAEGPHPYAQKPRGIYGGLDQLL